MNKTLRLASVALCATAVAAIAFADRLDYTAQAVAIFADQAPAGVTSHVGSGRTNWMSSDNFVGSVISSNTALASPVYRQSVFEQFTHLAVAPADCSGGNKVPDGANTVALLGLSTLGLVAIRRWFSMRA
jgi:hypothetical protein